MKKRLSALFLALVLGLSISVPAFAYEIAETSKRPADGNGRNYKIWATLYEDRGRYSAAAWIQSDDNSAIPVDQVTAQAFVKDETGKIVSSNESSLSSPYYFLVSQSSYSYFPGTEITAYGVLKVKQSSGKFQPFYTPELTTSSASRTLSADKVDDTLSVNSRGETYCSLSAATAEKHPDLVAAVGTEGQSGYVRYENLISVDERVFTGEYDGRHIPLYDLEGNNIGTFFIGYSQPDIIGKDIETVRAELADSTAQNPKLWALADKVLVNGEYPVNAKGQTYGSSSLRKIVGHSPDLIPAVPAEENNGVAGYIRCVKELPTSEEEVTARCAATFEPLYDVDGNVIGTFKWKSEPVQFLGKTVPEVQTELANRPQSR